MQKQFSEKTQYTSFYFLFILKIYFLFTVVLILCYCTWGLSSYGKRGLFSSCGVQLPVAVAFFLWNTGPRACGLRSCYSQTVAHRLSSCGTQA